jgi:hypothetical protein
VQLELGEKNGELEQQLSDAKVTLKQCGQQLSAIKINEQKLKSLLSES